MIILRDEAWIERRRQASKYFSLVGFLVLLGGLILGFINPERYGPLQVFALPLGFLLSQAGLYFAHRYLRSPRPDEVLDEAIGKVAGNSRLYHYLLPPPHVLLTPAGPIVLITKYQAGDISVDENDKWRQRGVGFLRRLFSQESLGNPTREAVQAVGSLVRYIKKHAPEVDEVPVGAVIVFTTKNAGELKLKKSSIPAMHYTKLRGFLKQEAQGPPLPQADYLALQAAFDRAATRVLPADEQ